MKWTIGLVLLCGGSALSVASDVVDVLPLTEKILVVHFDDGYVQHHLRGHKRSDEKVFVSELNVADASRTSTYKLESADDPAYAGGKVPIDIGRKSKGTDFAWFVDRWENNMAINDRPDHTKEHWLYLALPAPLKNGRSYVLRTGALAANGQTWKFTYSVATQRSEAVHTNLLGYLPDAPIKAAYVSHWMGDRGGLDVSPYAARGFWLRDEKTGKPVFRGRIALRKPSTNQETFHLSDALPTGNFIGADVYECDFSVFSKPGKYRVVVEGVGSSMPFSIDADVYRQAFVTTTRGLYHNRSGIELKSPFTAYRRPAPHNPRLTPGFAGKLKYTSVRWQDWGSEGGDKARLEAGIKGTLDSCGWYQDAGDWDSYWTHLRVAQELLFAFDLNRAAFADRELNIPESGNGIPDIIDEAAWLPRFCYRLRHELLTKRYGSGGIGLRVAGDAFGSDTGPNDVGRGSWEDVDRTYVVSGEDAVSTMRYAGVAAHLALALKAVGKPDPDSVNWEKEAKESYAWALAHTQPGDVAELLPHRAYASALLFRLTGQSAYEAQFGTDFDALKAKGDLWESAAYGPAAYALAVGPVAPNPALLNRVKEALYATADQSVSSADRRGMRWAGNWYFPMLVGQQTTPLVIEVALAYGVARQSDPARARRYRAALATTCDYFLGGNPMNMVWVSGLGPRSPRELFVMDDWYNGLGPNGAGKFHPGIVPYGPWRKEREVGQGPWDAAWANKTIYPAIDQWPGAERWFDNRCSPMASEFTVHQNTGPAAAIYGILCGKRG